MNEQIDTLEKMLSAALSTGEINTGEEIRELASSLRDLRKYSVNDNEIEELARELEERIGISMGYGAMVDDEEFVPWLNDAKSEIDPFFWDRYKQLLVVSKKLPRDVVTATDEVTERILSRLGNPNEKKWDRRGMVVGHVQSGKTANYTGLICKAADAGYKFIVVIAGIHNNLRNQTQARIDEGFIGRDTGRLGKGGKNVDKKIGVGKFNDKKKPISLTNTIKDFNKGTATTISGGLGSFAVPVVLVIKKNSNTLRNLIDWLKEHSARVDTEMVEQPMLLIDDEADNASINVKYTKEEVSRINGQIRDLLKLFQRSCYVGYTATPFANIFIDPDQEQDLHNEDLFPKNFIIGLDPPDNYFGPTKVFLDDNPEYGEPKYLRYVTDNEDVLPIKHDIGHQADFLPNSLLKALRTFVLARTIRNLRGHKASHATMLVNVSRFTGVQGRVRNRLHEALEKIRDSVKVNGSLNATSALMDPEISALHEVWQEEYTDSGRDWQKIQSNLLDTLKATKVVEVNSKNKGLDYDEARKRGLTVVAVGGFSLSRGLTLEGLTVSYFLRNSMMYDALMQMGRWFGYRDDYEDLCRIWMPYQAVGWYAHITEATNELFDELKRMENAKATPMQFGLAVRGHPNSLMVTARNKFGSGQKHVQVGLSCGYIETTRLTNEKNTLEENREAARELLKKLEQQNESIKHNRGYFYRNVPAENILDFLYAFRNDRGSVRSMPDPIRKYIIERGRELESWDVLIASVDENKERAKDDTLGWPLVPAIRSVGTDALRTNDVLAIYGRRARVAAGGIEKVGVDPGLAKAAERKFYEEKKKKNYPDRIYREVRKFPLFVLYPINVNLPEGEMDAELQEKLPKEPVVAWAISFPISSNPDAKVEYVMNIRKLQEVFGEEDTDEDMLDDE